jgi:N-acetylmuramoyl-L-alanine amidase
MCLNFKTRLLPMIHLIVTTIILSTLVLSGCVSHKLKLHDWQKLPEEHYTIPPYARYLADYKIALDPGHGGNAQMQGYKRGPAGKREAVMNLKVALALEEFLQRAGVAVFLTRRDDRFVSLKDRAAAADSAGCDFMISLHHNHSKNPKTNYSAVFYHLNPDFSPVSLDLARHIYFGLVDALRLPQVLDDGLLTDTILYPAGFGLLRRSAIPAILLESSFFSNKEEEKRLNDFRYNRREAYGIFLGLARWAAGGIPKTQKLSPQGISRDKRPVIEYRLSDGITERVGRGLDGLLLYRNSVSAVIDSTAVPVLLSDDKKLVRFSPDSALANGSHLIRVAVQNLFKNHNFPRTDTLVIAALTDSIDFRPAVTGVPADSMAMFPLLLTLLDADGEPVWDGTRVQAVTNKGVIAPAFPRLASGSATVYYRAPAVVDSEAVFIIASADGHADTLNIDFAAPGQTWLLSGVAIDDSTEMPIADAMVVLNDSLVALTDRNGVFFIQNPEIGFAVLELRADGYTGVPVRVRIDSMHSDIANFRLRANLGALLHGQIFILDAALDDSLPGDSFTRKTAARFNLEIAEQLADTLRWAGADVYLIRKGPEQLAVQQRIEMVNELPDGIYLKLLYERVAGDSLRVQVTIYPANKVGREIGESILAAFAQLPAVRTELWQNMQVPEVTYTNKTALEIKIGCLEPESRGRDLARIFTGIVRYFKEKRLEDSESKAR